MPAGAGEEENGRVGVRGRDELKLVAKSSTRACNSIRSL